MPRVITSPVAKWPGIVTLYEPLNFPQYLAWKQGLDRAAEANGHDLLVAESGITENAVLILPGVCGCVQTWNLQGLPEIVTPETFPSTPVVASVQLVIWLVSEIRKIVMGEEELPKE